MAAVTGVMIVTTLLLVIDLLTRTVATAVESPALATILESDEQDANAQAALLALLESEASTEIVSAESVARLGREADALAERLASMNAQRAAFDTNRVSSEQRMERARADAAALAEKLAEVRRRIDIARATPAVTLLEGDASGRPTWWVRIGSGALTAGPLRRADRADSPEADEDPQAWPDAESFLAEASTEDVAARAWVLLVEPDGVDSFNAVQTELRRRGFEVGWDLAPPLETENAP